MVSSRHRPEASAYPRAPGGASAVARAGRRLRGGHLLEQRACNLSKARGNTKSRLALLGLCAVPVGLSAGPATVVDPTLTQQPLPLHDGAAIPAIAHRPARMADGGSASRHLCQPYLPDRWTAREVPTLRDPWRDTPWRRARGSGDAPARPATRSVVYYLQYSLGRPTVARCADVNRFSTSTTVSPITESSSARLAETVSRQSQGSAPRSSSTLRDGKSEAQRACSGHSGGGTKGSLVTAQ